MNKNSLDLYKDIKIGIIGGSLQAFICMPFLTWKFAIQGNISLPKITNFIKLYRGSIQQISAHTPNTVIQILSNNILLNYLNKENISIYEKIGCSSMAGIISAGIFTPVDNLTIFQQKNKITLFEALKIITNKSETLSIHPTNKKLHKELLSNTSYINKFFNKKPLRKPNFILIQRILNERAQKQFLLKKKIK